MGARGGRKHPQTRSGARRWSSQCCSCATTHAPPAGRRWSRRGAARRARHSCAAAWRRPATCTSQGEEAEAHRRASWVLCCCVGLSRWHFFTYFALGRRTLWLCPRALVQLSSPPARAGPRGHFLGRARAPPRQAGGASARARTAHTRARARAHACTRLLECLLAFASMSRVLPCLFSWTHVVVARCPARSVGEVRGEIY